MKFLKENYLLLILLALVLLTRFLFLNYPAEVVFDEVHFGKFVSAYFTNEYYFDIHPPLGKLMIAGFAKLSGFESLSERLGSQSGLGFEKIGEAANAYTLFILRFLPALLGSLFVLIIYQIVIAFGGSKKAAFLAGFLIVFDNAFLVESKFILVDSFLFFFGFLAILLFLISRKQENAFKKYLFYFFSIICSSLAFSIKWTGLSFLGVILLFTFFDFLKKISLKRLFEVFVKTFFLIILFVFVYALPFVFHFKLLTLSGPGDAFMSQDFQKTLVKENKETLASLERGQETKTLSFGSKFIELNQKMYSYNVGLTKGHTDSSKWNEWPFLRKPVWYWEKKDINKTANIYLMGNPLIWLSAGLAIFWGIYRLFKTKNEVYLILLVGYFANLLPYMLVARAAFIYHYLPALVFAIILLASWIGKSKKEFYFSYLTTAFFIFLIMSPISYGILLPLKTTAIYKLLVGILHLSI